MTSRKLPTVLAILCGSFVIYCGQSAMNGGNPFGADGGANQGDGAFVGDAKADGTSSSGGACCTVTPQTFTNIAEGDIAVNGGNAPVSSPSIDVSPYREVVVLQSSPAAPCVTTGAGVSFKEPNSAVFVGDGQNASGRVRIDGPTMQLNFTTGSTGGVCAGTIHYVVAGVGLN